MLYQASKWCYKIKPCCRRIGRKVDGGKKVMNPNQHQEIIYEKQTALPYSLDWLSHFFFSNRRMKLFILVKFLINCLNIYLLFYVYECFAWMYNCLPHVCLIPAEAKKRLSNLLNLELDSCELPFRCWELDLGPLKELPVLLTTELSPQTLCYNML